jgi:hypothetical protein
MIYNIKEQKGKKHLAGLSLVCADPNAFSDPTFVGASGDGFAGEVINDYCPVGYMLTGAEFHTSDRTNLTGARRVCRRYQPYEERRGPNLYGEGAEEMANVCPLNHWVTGVKLSYVRAKDEAGKLDTTLLNARFFCAEIREWLVEPSQEELEGLSR